VLTFATVRTLPVKIFKDPRIDSTCSRPAPESDNSMIAWQYADEDSLRPIKLPFPFLWAGTDYGMGKNGGIWVRDDKCCMQQFAEGSD
jgi:hypothetical protein